MILNRGAAAAFLASWYAMNAALLCARNDLPWEGAYFIAFAAGLLGILSLDPAPSAAAGKLPKEKP